jgi:hypothetical protein
MGGETYVDGAGGILTSQPFATGGGLRGQNSAGRALQGGPFNLDVSTSDIGVCAVVPGERGDLHLARAGDAGDAFVELSAGDAPVEGPTR